MKSETIYEIMLSVLSGDATEDEHRQLNEWLACSSQQKAVRASEWTISQFRDCRKAR